MTKRYRPPSQKGGPRPHSRKQIFVKKRKEKEEKIKEEERSRNLNSSLMHQNTLDGDAIVFDFPELMFADAEAQNPENSEKIEENCKEKNEIKQDVSLLNVEAQNPENSEKIKEDSKEKKEIKQDISLLNLVSLWSLAENQKIGFDDVEVVEETIEYLSSELENSFSSDCQTDNYHNDVPNTNTEQVQNIQENINLAECHKNKENIDMTEDQLDDNEKKSYIMDGCRIVHYEHVIKDLLRKATDSSLHKDSCTLNKWELLKTKQRGFIVDVFLQCETCKATIKHTSQPEDSDAMNINEAIVLGCLTSGSGFSNMQELLAPAGIPSMSSTTYMEIQRKIVLAIIETSEEALLENVEEEKRLNKEMGNVIYYAAEDGTITEVIYTTAICDGAWMKRSYASGAFDSPAGSVIIIGKLTKKPLDVKVKCKTCAKCDSRKEFINDHHCFKNFPREKSSSLMETMCTVEAFHESFGKYGIVYKYFIGDGDSSVYNAILTDDPYSDFGIVVEKFEDINHKYKNHSKAIKNLNKKQGLNKAEKKWYQYASTFELVIHYELQQVVERRRIAGENLDFEDNLELLTAEIVNVPYHVFGDHTNCAKLGGWPCDGAAAENEENFVPYLNKYGVMADLIEIHRNLALNSKSLYLKTSTNLAENFNSVLCKYIAGKRMFFCNSGSFTARVHAAALKCLTKRVQSNVIQHVRKTVPSTVIKVESERINKAERNKLYNCKKGTFPSSNIKDDKDYGEKALKPDMTSEAFNNQKEIVFNLLKSNQQHRLEIAQNTIKQYQCNNWRLTRRKMITSSRYGKICRMNDTTPRRYLVSDMLYSTGKNLNADMKYGLQHEKDAISAFEKLSGCTVTPTGLWIDPVIEFLGASPDGLIDLNLEELKISKSLGIASMQRPPLLYNVEKGCCVEIKCPARGKNLLVNEVLSKFKDLKRIYNSKQPNLINKNHWHYYQLQGQMHHTERKDGLLVLWTDKDMKITPVFRDDNFWKTKMEPHLKKFYYDCLLPEIVDSRSKRSMVIKEPDYVVENSKNQKMETLDDNKTEPSSIYLKKTTAKKREAAKRKIKIEMDQDFTIESNKTEPSSIYLKKTTPKKREAAKRKIKIEMDQDFTIESNNDSKKIKIAVQEKSLPSSDDDEDIVFVPNDYMEEIEPYDRAILLACPFNNINRIARRVLNVNKKLHDRCLDTFLFLLGEQFKNFQFLSVLNMSLPYSVKECLGDEDVQIIGGNATDHWRTCHYKKKSNELFVYESFSPVEYKNLSDVEKIFLSKRYPSINENNFISIRTAPQRDGTTCGVFAAAAVVSVLLGKDMKTEYFSENSLLMRKHFVQILNSRQVECFPQLKND